MRIAERLFPVRCSDVDMCWMPIRRQVDEFDPQRAEGAEMFDADALRTGSKQP
ncbi:hypothetical protein ACQP2U_21815 [Nocardia sp. CA-084685]|uniref:hypothetical protein n=1 Tax=Nocardia sp. CA-084685 TaxID=3239970 RepID=UPI003D98A1D8